MKYFLTLLMLLLPVLAAGQSQESSSSNSLPYDWKSNCRLATAAALPAVTALPQSLTATVNGALTVDGVAVVAGDRIVVKNQALPAQDGLFRVSRAGDGSTTFLLTRDSDGNDWRDYPGSVVGITSEGATNRNTWWRCTAAVTGTVGTTPIIYESAGTGSGSGSVSVTSPAALNQAFFRHTFKTAADSTPLEQMVGERGTWRYRGVIGSDALYCNVTANGYNTCLPFGSGYGWFLNDRPPGGMDYSTCAVLRWFSDDGVSGMGVGVRCAYTMDKGVFAGWDNAVDRWVIRYTTNGTAGITDLATGPATTLTAKEYTMELNASGSTFTLFVDGLQVAQGTNASFTDAGAAFIWGRNQVVSETTGVGLVSAWGVDRGIVPPVVTNNWGFFLEGESLDGTVNFEFLPTDAQTLTTWMHPRVAQNWAIDGRPLSSAAGNVVGMGVAHNLMVAAGCESEVYYFLNGVNDLFNGGGGTGVSETMATSASTAITNAKAAGGNKAIVMIGNLIRTGATDGIANAEAERLDYNNNDLPAVVAAAGGAANNVYIIPFAAEACFSDVQNPLIYVQIDVSGINDTHLTPLGHYRRARVMQAATDAALANVNRLTAAGTFTSVGTNVLNTTTITPSPGQWMRTGNVVTYSLRMTVLPAGASLTTFRLSLPVASNFTVDTDAAGTASAGVGGSIYADVSADITNDQLLVRCTPSVATSQVWGLNVTYTVK